MSRDFVRRYMSDPIRRTEMAIGGNAVKGALGKSEKFHRDNIEKDLGPMFINGKVAPKWKDYADANDTLDKLETGTELTTGIALGGKISGSTISKLWNAGKLGRAAVAMAPTGLGGRIVSDGVSRFLGSKENYENIERETRERELENLYNRNNPAAAGRVTTSAALDWQKALAGGGIGAISGALLGKLFGGNKLAKWLALLGLVLGGAHGSGALDGMWTRKGA
jgi:hypothetical protein